MTGIITRFFFQKGYGFVKGDDGQSYFLHHSVYNGFLEPGMKLKFEVAENAKGPYVKKII